MVGGVRQSVLTPILISTLVQTRQGRSDEAKLRTVASISWLLTHSFIHLIIHPVVHPVIRSLIRSFIHSFVQSVSPSLTHSFIHSPIHPSIQSVSQSFSHSFTCSTGRSIDKVDIRPFINNLPFGRDTSSFSTQDASGSTSQAANIIEGVEAGSKCLLIDEVNIKSSASRFSVNHGFINFLDLKKEEKDVNESLA